MIGFLKRLRDEEEDSAATVAAVQTEPDTPPPPQAPQPWDPAAAARVLAQLHADIDLIRQHHYHGALPPHVARLAADSVAIAERYVRTWQDEATRGWDPMQLLKDLVASTPGILRGDRLRWGRPQKHETENEE
jgi:hypothetical protein